MLMSLVLGVVWLLTPPVQVAPPVSPHAVDRSLNIALGVECTHCHAATDMRDRTNPTFAVAARMMAMVTQLNGGPLADTAGVTCWSCHAGRTRPSRVAVARWQEERDRNFVGDLASAPDSVKLAMAVYNASLDGVSCDYCHVPGDWKKDQKAPFKMVARMSTMIDSLPAFLPPGARTQCFMCHKGRTAPATAPLRR